MLLESTRVHGDTPDPGLGGLHHTGSSRVQTVPDEHSGWTTVQNIFQCVVNQDQSNWDLFDGEFRQINVPGTETTQGILYPPSLDQKIIVGLEDGEAAHNPVHGQLVEEVVRVWKSARGTLHAVENGQAEQAFHEAIVLTYSRLFSTEIYPDVCVDAYGEFTFSHMSPAGYVDIGVRGAGEISYHVRNDIDPDKTAFADCEWDLGSLPPSLSIAMEALQNAIREQGST